MRALVFFVLLASASCATTARVGQARTAVLRDVEGYAIASCLAHQSDPCLQHQGEGWASAIIQRGEGSLDAFTTASEKVKAELAKGHMAVIRTEAPSAAGEKTLPVLYCSEIIDAPVVRAAIQTAVKVLAPAYEGTDAPTR